MLNVPEQKTLISVKNMAKIYYDHIKVIDYKKEFQIQQKGYENKQKKTAENKTTKNKRSESEGGDSLLRSRRRTKNIISDLCLNNKFDLFITFTFAKDRYNVDNCKKRMSIWLKNQKKIHGNFEYLIIPEFHKDNKAIHFHALFQGYKGKITPACKKSNKKNYCNKKHKHTTIKQRGKQVFNLPSYTHGYTNASHIQDPHRTSSYIRKYVTKDMPQFSGKKRYWRSNGLNRPEVVYNIDLWSIPFLKPELTYSHKYFDIWKIDATMISRHKKIEGLRPLFDTVVSDVLQTEILLTDTALPEILIGPDKPSKVTASRANSQLTPHRASDEDFISEWQFERPHYPTS